MGGQKQDQPCLGDDEKCESMTFQVFKINWGPVGVLGAMAEIPY